MEIGAMNSPFVPVADEIRRIATAGFDYVDLTLEPPGAWPVEPEEIRALLADAGLGAVGHTAWYLPIASPFAPLRAAARETRVAAFDAFAAVGAELVNVHPDPVIRTFPRAEVVAQNVEAVRELAGAARSRGLVLMVENLGSGFGSSPELAPLLDADPAIRFHLDVGHAYLGGERFDELLAAFSDRLAHVHVSDNFGVDDLHLPLGAGSIPWPDVIAALHAVAYHGTVTLEVFSSERRHLDASRRLWRQWWDDPARPARGLM